MHANSLTGRCCSSATSALYWRRAAGIRPCARRCRLPRWLHHRGQPPSRSLGTIRALISNCAATWAFYRASVSHQAGPGMAETLKTTVAVIGVDIGKNSFHAVGLDRRGAIVLRQRWSRSQVESRFANMSPCLIGMEGCIGAHQISVAGSRRVVTMPLRIGANVLRRHQPGYRRNGDTCLPPSIALESSRAFLFGGPARSCSHQSGFRSLLWPDATPYHCHATLI